MIDKKEITTSSRLELVAYDSNSTADPFGRVFLASQVEIDNMVEHSTSGVFVARAGVSQLVLPWLRDAYSVDKDNRQWEISCSGRKID